MQRIEIKQWNGQLQNPRTIEKIRRKIAGGIKCYRTVLIDFEDAKELTSDLVLQIIDGWKDSQVKIISCGREK